MSLTNITTASKGRLNQLVLGVGNNQQARASDLNTVINALNTSTLVASASPVSITAGSTPIVSTYSKSASTTGNIVSSEVTQLMTGASASNTVEMSRFVLTSAVEMGTWANAVLAKVDLTTTGYVSGLVGVVCAELDMPSTAPAGGAGTYTCYEAEINMAGATTVPVSAFVVNAWGAQVASFDTNGYLFDISGVTKASGKIFQDNTAAAASQALRIRINGTKYYIMLTSTGA